MRFIVACSFLAAPVALASLRGALDSPTDKHQGRALSWTDWFGTDDDDYARRRHRNRDDDRNRNGDDGSDGINIEGPWGRVHVGTDGVHVNVGSQGAVGIEKDDGDLVALGDLDCKSLENYRTDADCSSTLSDYYAATSKDSNFSSLSSRSRNRVVKDFCRTDCGRSYTASIVAPQLHCESTSPDKQSSNTTTSSPDWADGFPGLQLGCLRDQDNYCAALKGDTNNGDCAFYRSCCYAELHHLHELSSDERQSIEDTCPGSEKYLDADACGL